MYLNRGENLFFLGFFKEAFESTEKAVEIYRHIYEETDFRVIKAYRNMVKMLFQRGEHDETWTLQEKTLKLQRERTGIIFEAENIDGVQKFIEQWEIQLPTKEQMAKTSVFHFLIVEIL